MSIYGRYEMRNPASNTRKFWHIVFDKSKQVAICTWGRIGNNSPPPMEYDLSKAEKKIREKLKKGYSKVTGYDEEIGCQSIHFITEMCNG